MGKAETKWDWLATFFIKHAVTIFVIATVVCLALITYLTNHLTPYVIGAWVVVGILTSLLFSGVALVVVLAVAAVDKARHLKVLTYEPQSHAVLKDRFERERIAVADFYSPYLVARENKRFIACEVQGPGGIQLLGESMLEDCIMQRCDYIVVNEGDVVNTAAHFKDTVFTSCTFVNVALYVTSATAEALRQRIKAQTGETVPLLGFEKCDIPGS